MPSKTIWEQNGVFWESHGKVERQEIEVLNHEFYTDIRSYDAKYQIFDLSHAEDLVLTKQDITYFAALDKGASQSIKNIKLAFVTDNPNFRESIQVYINLSSKIDTNWTIEIFENINQAREWVERP